MKAISNRAGELHDAIQRALGRAKRMKPRTRAAALRLQQACLGFYLFVDRQQRPRLYVKKAAEVR